MSRYGNFKSLGASTCFPTATAYSQYTRFNITRYCIWCDITKMCSTLQTPTFHSRYFLHGPDADVAVVYKHPHPVVTISTSALTQMMLLSTDIDIPSLPSPAWPSRWWYCCLQTPTFRGHRISSKDLTQMMLLSTDIHIPWPPSPPWISCGWCYCLYTRTSRGHHFFHGPHADSAVGVAKHGEDLIKCDGSAVWRWGPWGQGPDPGGRSLSVWCPHHGVTSVEHI